MDRTWVRAAGVTGAVLLATSTLMGVAAADPKPGSGKAAKVTICHRTNSEKNPYVRITVNTHATGTPGHQGHTGPVYEPGMKASGTKWGDIIPSHDDAGGPLSPLNWSAAGQAIWNAGCRVPTPPPTTTTAPPTTTTAAPIPPGPAVEQPPTDDAVDTPTPDAEVESASVDREVGRGTATAAAGARPATAIAAAPGYAG